MRRRNVQLAVSATVLLGVVGIAAGCGSQGTKSASPNTVIGTLPKPTVPSTTKGNPANGKVVFTSAGCAGCHTFTPAGSTANVGPNLDNLSDYAKKAGQPVDVFTHGAIVSPPPAYVPPGYPTNVMPTTFGQTLKPQEIADLVAFLTGKS
jgi:mono/diheme cytochrome c family protein